MNPRRGLVLDANILMRAVLGRRVRELLELYEDGAAFYSPDVCFEDARHYVPQAGSHSQRISDCGPFSGLHSQFEPPGPRWKLTFLQGRTRGQESADRGYQLPSAPATSRTVRTGE